MKEVIVAHPAEQLIFAAVARDDAGAIQSLLADNPSLIEARSGWQLYRPLFFAMEGARTAALDVLRRHGAALDVFEAAALGDVVALRALLHKSPKLANARREHYDATPLHAARGNLAAATLLIECGAQVNAIDSDKQRLTPLHGRAEHGDIDMVELLLCHGADVHAASCMGTPLHCAVAGFQHEPPPHWREVAERLLNAGADIDAGCPHTGDPNWTPLHHAAWRNHVTAVSWLLERGADRTRVNRDGSTPLETARHFGHKEIVELLG